MHPAVAQSLFVRKPSRVGGFVLLSVAIHLALIGVAVGFGMLNRPPPLKLEQEPIKASLVRRGKERDKRLLPRKEELPPPPKEVKAPPQPVATPTPPKPVEAVPVPGVKPAPQPAKQPGAKDGDQKKPSLFDAFSKAAATAPADELEGQEDGDPFGDSAVQEGERYYGALKAQVRRYYDVSNTIGEQDRLYLRAQVLIRIGKSGELLLARLAKSSGNDLFDSAVVSAAKKASPYSPPPDHLRRDLEGQGILLEFSP